MRFVSLGALILAGVYSVAGLAAAPTVVALGEIQASPAQGELVLAGELRAVRGATISTEVAGSVASIAVESGDRVEAETVLATMRQQPARLILRAARARVVEAEAGVDRAAINERRFGRLLQRKALSQDEYDTARVELNKARAVLETRRAEAAQSSDQLDRHRVRAPFAGVVVARHIERGQWLDEGDACYDIEDISQDGGHGMGLKNIRDRIASLNGKLDMKSKSGEGTEVHIIVDVS